MLTGIKKATCGLVVPLSFFLTACGDGHHTSSSMEMTRTTDHSLVGEPIGANVRSDEQPGVSEARYDISLDEIREHVRNGSAVMVDARSPEDFQRGHVRGAINVPSNHKETYVAQLKRDYPADQLIIIYCGSSQCHAGDSVYDYAISQGFTNMRVFKAGWKGLSSEKDLQ
jgi:rhodanese-related sulfurtransferase